MEPITKPKPKAIPTTRAVLSEDSVRKIESWLIQVTNVCPGIRLKRQDLVNWLVTEKGEQLSPSDLKSVKDRFYDEIELAQWALSQLIAAKIRNERVSLNELIRGGGSSPGEPARRKIRKKPPSNSSNQLPQNEVGAQSGHEQGEML